MTIDEILKVIKENRLPNITKRLQVSDERLITLINEAMVELYTTFDILFEQAIIIPTINRQIYKISDSDKHVLMATIYKMNRVKFNKDKDISVAEILRSQGYEEDLIEALTDHKDIVKPLPLQKNEVEALYKVLQIIDVEDDEGNEYDFNVTNVFITDHNTLYFPNCKEGSKIYVKYKPYPPLYSIDNKLQELKLPDTLINCLYAFIDLRVITGVEGLQQFYPNALNTYNQCLDKALLQGSDLPKDLTTSLEFKKGFF